MIFSKSISSRYTDATDKKYGILFQYNDPTLVNKISLIATNHIYHETKDLCISAVYHVSFLRYAFFVNYDAKMGYTYVVYKTQNCTKPMYCHYYIVLSLLSRYLFLRSVWVKKYICKKCIVIVINGKILG